MHVCSPWFHVLSQVHRSLCKPLNEIIAIKKMNLESMNCDLVSSLDTPDFLSQLAVSQPPDNLAAVLQEEFSVALTNMGAPPPSLHTG